jgi:2-polyprenyl-3-methyl-5-hydroxy-6-metoxy-1,4-benzoquinol methylase
MSSVIHYTACPACGSSNISYVLDAEDYTVTQQTFQIWECARCTVRFTQDVPSEEEIGRYYQSENYISHSDTNEGLVNRLYHKVRERSLNNKRNLIDQYVSASAGEPLRLLDVGCGTGAFLNHMRRYKWAVEGIEPSEDARKKADKLYNLLVYSPEKFFDSSLLEFNAITLWHVLEHVHLLHEYLERLKELLLRNGTLFIAVPNYTSYDAKAYGSYWAAYDVPRHLYHFSPASMRLLLNNHGLQLKAIKPMWYDSFYVSMLSAKYKTGKQNLIKGGIIGAYSNISAFFNKERCSSLIYVIGK